MYPRLHTAIWSSAQNFLDWPTGNFKEVYKILMNFSHVKNYKKNLNPLPWACYTIITEYVGLFFILSNCSIQSTFFFLQNFSMRCFRCGKQYTVQKPITRSLNNNFSLESTPSRIFLLSFDFFLFFIFFLFIYFFTFMFSSSKLQYSRLYLFQAYEGTEICLNFKFCEKRGNTDLRAGAKLTT